MKSLAFACARLLLFSRTGLSNLLNKYSLPLKRPFKTIFALILAQGTRGWVGRRMEGGVGRGVGREGAKPSQVKT